MTPVIGSFSQAEHTENNDGIQASPNEPSLSLFEGPIGYIPVIRTQKSMKVIASARTTSNQAQRVKYSPQDSMFSRLPMSSMGEIESVASSAYSSVSTRNQIDKCKDVLTKALNLKKLVSSGQ